MKFYIFRQNNSRGVFTKEGVVILIEAPNADAANERAEDIGVYFDGVNRGIDCPCCGSRWQRADEYESVSDLAEYTNAEYLRKYVHCWMNPGVAIHYADGRVERF